MKNFNYEKANALRKEANKQSSLEKLYSNKWLDEANKAKTAKARKAVDKKYKAIMEKQGNKSDEAYKNYYTYIHSHASKEKIDSALKKARKTKLGFTSNIFLKEIENK